MQNEQKAENKKTPAKLMFLPISGFTRKQYLSELMEFVRLLFLLLSHDYLLSRVEKGPLLQCGL
jgi:hypothetical protein